MRQYEFREIREKKSKSWMDLVPVFVGARGQAASDEVPDLEENGRYDPLWYCLECTESGIELIDLVEKVVGA